MDEAVTPDVLRVARMIVASGVSAAGAAPVRTEPYRVDEAAKALGISRPTMYREIARGNCRAERFGVGRGTIRITVEDFAEYKRKIRTQAVTVPLAATA